MYEKGSVSWAYAWARSGAVVYNPGSGDAKCDVHGELVHEPNGFRVAIRQSTLTGWSIKTPAPEPEEFSHDWAVKQLHNRVRVEGSQSDGYQEVVLSPPGDLAWAKVCEPIFKSIERRYRLWIAAEPETEDVPIEEFRLYRRQARGHGATAEGQFKASIKCYLYPQAMGGFTECCAPLMWRDACQGAYFPSAWPPRTGDWVQATHVRLLKKEEE